LLLLEGTAPFQKARVRMQRRFWTRCQAFWQWACIRPRNVCLSLCLSVAMSCSSAFTFEKGEGGIQFQSRSLVFSFFFMSGSSGCPIRGVKRWRGPIAAHFESYLFPWPDSASKTSRLISFVCRLIRQSLLTSLSLHLASQDSSIPIHPTRRRIGHNIIAWGGAEEPYKRVADTVRDELDSLHAPFLYLRELDCLKITP
jgi:hypothetical protein